MPQPQIKVSELIVLQAALRLAGTAAIFKADSLLSSPPELRPELLAKAIMAGEKSAELATLIKAAKLPAMIAGMIRQRTQC